MGLSSDSSSSFTPFSLGASLLAYWDAEDASSLSLTGSSVNSWTDRKSGYATTQATGGAKPVYSTTSFNGRPGLTFDGVDDTMSMTGVGALPVGANASEVWVLVEQTALDADTTTRGVFAYGGASASNRRSLSRVRPDTVSRARYSVGDGAVGVQVDETATALNGYKLIRATATGTISTISVNGGTAQSTSVVPASGNSTIRIGSILSSGNFWQGQINTVLVTALLSNEQSAQLTQYLKSRGGIA